MKLRLGVGTDSGCTTSFVLPDQGALMKVKQIDSGCTTSYTPDRAALQAELQEIQEQIRDLQDRRSDIEAILHVLPKVPDEPGLVAFIGAAKPGASATDADAEFRAMWAARAEEQAREGNLEGARNAREWAERGRPHK